jgi:hypothetical protein
VLENTPNLGECSADSTSFCPICGCIDGGIFDCLCCYDE